MNSSGPAAVAIFIILAQLSNTTALDDSNSTTTKYVSILNKRGEEVLVTQELWAKLRDEAERWHWLPYHRIRTTVEDSIMREACMSSSSADSFPSSLFTDEQLRMGAFLFYVLFGAYSFILLATVCNDYFIPCVEIICEELKIPQNVAAATFMSVATSCPEFFVNLISTFLTQSDMGIGTIVGSAIFNALGVGAVGGIAAIAPIAIERSAVTRDVLIYMVNVSVLVTIVWDGQVEWYEALVLGIMYVLYFVVMFNSLRIFRCCRFTRDAVTKSLKPKKLDAFPTTNNKSVEEGNGNVSNGISTAENVGEDGKTIDESKKVVEKTKSTVEKEIEDDEEEPPRSLWVFPKERSVIYKIWWLVIWPLRFLLKLTIPSPVTCRRFYPLAFLMCIIWIGVNSYFVSWSMTIIGNTFLIPDSVMGMTFLAFGGCLPEACSIFIMSRRGKGGIGVSNALGGNSLAILFALGLPWLIKTMTLLAEGADVTAIHINSTGIEFVVASLLIAVICLWIVLFFSKFVLKRSMGFILASLYLVFITFAILVEMGVILPTELLMC